MTVGLNRKDLVHPWLLARCKEVQASPNGHLDLWARAHYKSTIITLGLTIQDILSSHGDNPDPKWGGTEITVGLFSVTRPLSKQFLAQIKREFETNEVLRQFFPDVLWENPAKDAPSWSLDSGIIVKRRANPKEATIEAHGLVDGQPTSKHFDLLIYDDVVTIDSVRNPAMIEKTTQAWELSLNLGTVNAIYRYIGTRYHYNDTYKSILERGSAVPRLHPATIDGTVDGEPVLLSRDMLIQKRRDMGPYVFNSQMLQNPVADNSQGFQRIWLRFYDSGEYSKMNRYILVDPANEKKTSNDYTVMMVIGLGPDENYYIIDIVRDRLSLTERAATLFRLHRKYKPKAVGYEQYGMQADIAHMKDKMKRDNYNFKIVALGGSLAKVDRIKALIPIFEQGRMYLPNHCYKTNCEKKTEDLTEIFLTHEYDTFPVCRHDDMLDCLARILHVHEDWKVLWPLLEDDDEYFEPDSGSAWSA
jgi:predicted phage terminase large subunit-like protein